MLGKLGEILKDETVAGAAEAVQPVLDVGRVARLRHLAVIDDVEAGVDIVNDGEMSKPSYATYVKDRLTGFGGASKAPCTRT